MKVSSLKIFSFFQRFENIPDSNDVRIVCCVIICLNTIFFNDISHGISAIGLCRIIFFQSSNILQHHQMGESVLVVPNDHRIRQLLGKGQKCTVYVTRIRNKGITDISIRKLINIVPDTR